jgi:hypothetical protein
MPWHPYQLSPVMSGQLYQGHNRFTSLENFIGTCIWYFPSHKRTHFIPILKGEVIHLLNYALCLEDIWGSDDIASPFLASVPNGGELSADTPAVLSQRKQHLVPTA